jgi:hypothetical protein
MISILPALAAGLLPVAIDGIRAAINRITGNAGAAPSNPEQLIAIMQAETERLKAVAEIDKPGDVARWVNNVRAMQRPIVVATVLLVWAIGSFIFPLSAPVYDLVSQLTSTVVFYLFGDRTYLYLKNRITKA